MQIKPGEIYGCSDPEFVGSMPVRTEIEVLSADEPKGPQWDDHIIINPMGGLMQNTHGIGVYISEKIGIAVINPRGVTAGRKSVVIGK